MMAIGVLDRSHDRQRRSGISWVQPPRSSFGQRQAQVDMRRTNVRTETLIAKLKVNRGFILTDCG